MTNSQFLAQFNSALTKFVSSYLAEKLNDLRSNEPHQLSPAQKAWVTRRKNAKAKVLSPAQMAWVTRRRNEMGRP